MAAKIKQALGADVVLVPEGRGIFDVSIDGELVYSKIETGTFPDEELLVSKLVSKYAAN